MQTRQPIPPNQKFALRIDEACEVSGLSRSTIYQCIREGTLASKKVAGRRVVTPEALRAFLNEAAK